MSRGGKLCGESASRYGSYSLELRKKKGRVVIRESGMVALPHAKRL